MVVKIIENDSCKTDYRLHYYRKIITNNCGFSEGLKKREDL